MPFKYMGAVFFGNGLSSICCNVLRGVTLVSFPSVEGDDEQTKLNNYYAAIIFLSIGSVALFLAVLVQIMILKDNPYYIYHVDWIVAAKERSGLDESEE